MKFPRISVLFRFLSYPTLTMMLLRINCVSVRLLIRCVYSGVQRLLDAQGQRGSWMPSNFFKTSSLKNIFYSSRKISNDLFSRSPKFSNSSPKLSDDFFLVIYPNCSPFRISFQISRKFAHWLPPSAASYPGNDIFLFIF